MLVPSRSESGQWVMWRVGRRRLAWRPRSVARFLDGADGPLFVAFAVPVVGWLLANWVGALLATLVVWPARTVSGRWRVVAYLLDPPGGDDRLQRVHVRGRARAQAVAQQWVLDIKRQGRPQLSVGPDGCDDGGSDCVEPGSGASGASGTRPASR
jgi:hypothetical protein